MATYGSISAGTVEWGSITSASSSTYAVRAYVVEEPKKPDTPEQWLRSRVEEICELVDFD